MAKLPVPNEQLVLSDTDAGSNPTVAPHQAPRRSGRGGGWLLLFTWFFSTGFLVLFALAAGWFGGRILPWDPISVPWKDSPTLIRQVEGLNELVTVKYVVEKVLLSEDNKWYGDNRVLMIAHGVVKAGVDLSKLSSDDIHVQGKTVRIRLPRPKITDAYLDDRRTQVIERSTAVLRFFDKDLEQDGRRHAVDTIRLSARDAGILQDAEDRAHSQLRQLFTGLGFEVIEFIDPNEPLHLNGAAFQ